eukprot:7411913-Pyramimonas_sp.AAC.1
MATPKDAAWAVEPVPRQEHEGREHPVADPPPPRRVLSVLRREAGLLQQEDVARGPRVQKAFDGGLLLAQVEPFSVAMLAHSAS